MRWGGLHLPAPASAGVPDRLLDRLIGGRAWIAVIAFALIGIVAMQLWVVKLGVGIGRALEHTQLVQQENSTLASEVSALSSAERIEQLALAKGMVPASPAALHFDTLRGPLDARLAAAALAKPIQAPTSGSTPVGGAATSTEASTGAVGAATSESSASGEPSPAAAPPARRRARAPRLPPAAKPRAPGRRPRRRRPRPKRPRSKRRPRRRPKPRPPPPAAPPKRRARRVRRRRSEIGQQAAPGG